MTFKRWYSLLFLLIIVTAGGVFRMKYAVMDLEKKLKTINKKIIFFQKSKHLLDAEWSVLNSPKRLERLSTQHLKLHPTKGQQIILWDQLPVPSQVPGFGPEINEDLKSMTFVSNKNNKKSFLNSRTEVITPESNFISSHHEEDQKNLSNNKGKKITTSKSQPKDKKTKKPLKLEEVINTLIDRAMQVGD